MLTQKELQYFEFVSITRLALHKWAEEFRYSSVLIVKKKLKSICDLFNHSKRRVMGIVNINALRKEYGDGENRVIALDGIDLVIEKGEFVAIVGASGSGKTTLLNMIGGLDNPSSGQVEIEGKNIDVLSEDQKVIFRRRNIGFVFQNYNLVTDLNVYENIVLPLLADGEKVNCEYFDEIVRILGLEEKLQSMPQALSGGQQQRVAIARALLTKPAIILADEPTGNLDSKTSLEVMNLLKGSAKRYNQTVVLITHNDFLAQMADRVIRINDGKIVEE